MLVCAKVFVLIGSLGFTALAIEFLFFLRPVPVKNAKY